MVGMNKALGVFTGQPWGHMTHEVIWYEVTQHVFMQYFKNGTACFAKLRCALYSLIHGTCDPYCIFFELIQAVHHLRIMTSLKNKRTEFCSCLSLNRLIRLQWCWRRLLESSRLSRHMLVTRLVTDKCDMSNIWASFGPSLKTSTFWQKMINSCVKDEVSIKPVAISSNPPIVKFLMSYNQHNLQPKRIRNHVLVSNFAF